MSLQKIYQLLNRLRSEILKPIKDGFERVKEISEQVAQLREEVKEIKTLLTGSPSEQAARTAKTTPTKTKAS